MPDDDLFPPHTRARTEDPWTSHAAAARIMHTLTDKQRKVYSIYCKHRNGLTEWELEIICGSHGSTWRTRVSELEQMGLLVKCGAKRIADSVDPRAHRTIWICREYAPPTLL